MNEQMLVERRLTASRGNGLNASMNEADDREREIHEFI